MTAEEVFSKYCMMDKSHTYYPYIIEAMEEYASLKLKEQETVAYMVNSQTGSGNNYYDAIHMPQDRKNFLIRSGYTITELIRKNP